MDLFRRKSVTALQQEALTDQSLKRALGALNLTLLGIGAIIGTGIFVLTGTVAAQNAGPAVVLSFIAAGIASFLNQIGIHIPAALTAARGTVVTLADGSTVTALFNLPAVFIIAVVSTLLVIGIKESATVNNVIVFVKVAVVLLFIVGAAHAVTAANWKPFIPENTTGEWGRYGWSGVLQGGAIVFFAYIGFDAVSTAAQEAKNP